eukprot:3144489-Rhodomonas_salina.1
MCRKTLVFPAISTRVLLVLLHGVAGFNQCKYPCTKCFSFCLSSKIQSSVSLKLPHFGCLLLRPCLSTEYPGTRVLRNKTLLAELPGYRPGSRAPAGRCSKLQIPTNCPGEVSTQVTVSTQSESVFSSTDASLAQHNSPKCLKQGSLERENWPILGVSPL